MDRGDYLQHDDATLRSKVRERLNGGFPTVYDSGRGKIAAFEFRGQKYHFVRSNERDIMLDILTEVPAKEEELKHLGV